LFTSDGKTSGVAAATALRVLADGTHQDVPVFACTGAGACTALPIDLSTGVVYLTLYGTGFRKASYIQCDFDTDGSHRPATTYFGAQPVVPGLDQINLLLSPLVASSVSRLTCGFGGSAITAAVQIRIK
jgi:hypothetical protein